MMSKHGKRWRANAAKIEKQKMYTVAEALELLKSLSPAKFNETVDVSIRLGVDPKKSDQMVRGVVRLPHGTGRSVRVLVFAKGEKEIEAKEAGADIVGGEELIERIQSGDFWEFDKAIATPDMMPKVGMIAKLLGPKGLMPNPKVGTVTMEVGRVVQEEKAGRVEFRVEKAGILHCLLGKLDFPSDHLRENLSTLLDQVVRLKPATSKGNYLLGMTLKSTMSPGIKLDLTGF
jgi:large subunit ribosomal protein L1